MTLARDAIQAAFAAYHEHSDKGDWNAWVDLFSDDCSFSAPYSTEPIKGRENLRAFAAGWPKVTNRPEWVVIDGNRLVFAWNTRNDRMPPSASSFRGVTTLVFDATALIREYEEWCGGRGNALQRSAVVESGNPSRRKVSRCKVVPRRSTPIRQTAGVRGELGRSGRDW